MTPFHFSILFSGIINAVLGISVLATHRHRRANRAFFFLTLSISTWLFAQWMALRSQNEQSITFWIRQASALALLSPFACNLLRLTIIRPHRQWKHILKHNLYWMLSYIPIAILCQTPWFIRGMSPSPNGIHVPVYGPGAALYILYFIASILFVVRLFHCNIRQVSGLERTELQFTLLGCGLAMVAGVLFALMLPNLTPYPELVQFSPLSIILMDGFIAYGIATRRIMGVENVVRIATAYFLLIAYLVLLYLGTRFISTLLYRNLTGSTFPLPEMISAIVVAFSLSPMHGKLQNVANRLFVNWHATDVEQSARRAANILQSISTLDDLMERFSLLVAQSLGTDDVRILLLNRSENRFEQALPLPKTGKPILQLAADHPLAQTCKVHREAFAAELLRRNPAKIIHSDLLPAMHDLRASVIAGIQTQKELTGIILLGNRLSGRIYGLAELQTLQMLASQLGVALDNAQLYTEVKNAMAYHNILLENMVSGVIAINSKGMVTLFNREAQRITQTSSADVLKKPVDQLPSPLRLPLEKALRYQSIQRDQDSVLTNQNGESIPLRIGSTLLRDHEGALLGALIVFSDISHIRELETQVRRTDRLASLGTLSAGMAHEIKNPLVSIKTFTDLLPTRYDDPDFRDTFSNLVGHEVRRIDTIVNQLLRFARPVKPNFNVIHLHPILTHCSSLLQQQLDAKSIRLVLELAAGHDQIKGDSILLEQAFINLMLNAVDAMDAQGVLTLRTCTKRAEADVNSNSTDEGFKILVFVEDTGQGIAEADLPHIFDPFYTTKDDGTGMGLAVTYKILQDHHVEIDLHSEKGKGSSFGLAFLPSDPVEEPV